MTERARREYAEALRPHYAQADKRERGRMLDEYCRATSMHRKCRRCRPPRHAACGRGGRAKAFAGCVRPAAPPCGPPAPRVFNLVLNRTPVVSIFDGRRVARKHDDQATWRAGRSRASFSAGVSPPRAIEKRSTLYVRSQPRRPLVAASNVEN